MKTYKADAKRCCCAFEASSDLAMEWTDYLLPSRILHYCSQIAIEAVDADGAQRLQAVRERRALSGNCNTRQHQLFANGSTRRRQAVQRASRRSPHLSCTPGTRHGIDAAMQSCNHATTLILMHNRLLHGMVMS
jgi:hypothetical protein